MKQKVIIPYAFMQPSALRPLSRSLFGIAQKISLFFPKLDLELKQSKMPVPAEEYIAMALASDIILVLILSPLVFLFSQKLGNPLFTPIIVGVVCLFILLQQMMFPKFIANKKVKDIERNLLPALRSMKIQINAGVPLFDIIATIATKDYGKISEEFKEVTKKINTGMHEEVALEELARNNPSIYFQRAIWQIVNGLKSGTTLNIILEQSISTLSQEQAIQIEQYGSQLNPLAMFYMLAAIIVPALGMTFLIVLTSFVSLGEILTKVIFIGFLGGVIFIQIFFLGILRTKRPNMLE